MRCLWGAALIVAAASCSHHAPPPTTTATAPSAPAAYQDTAAAWAGLHPRPDSGRMHPDSGRIHPDSTVKPAAATAAPPPSKPDSGSTNTWMAANLAIGDGVFIVRAHYEIGRAHV